jgi:hypothetical protein
LVTKALHFVCSKREPVAMECDPAASNASLFADNVSRSAQLNAVNLSRLPRRKRVGSVSNASHYNYSPIAYYNGAVLKCQGLVSEQNREWMPSRYPGVIELVGYRGDRICADSHLLFTE